MSIKEEDMDITMSKIFETLNLNSFSEDMHNLSLNELKNSLMSLGQFVIVGKFVDEDKQSPAQTKTNATSQENAKKDYASFKLDAQTQSTKKYHDEKIFNLSCRCSECTKHRETLIQLYLEDYEYNKLWERLQKHLLTFYDIIPQSNDSPIFKKYKELMDRNQTLWVSDGAVDLKNNFRLCLGNYLPLNDEMVFTILCNRDPHQLFELICIQMQAVVLAYTEGLKNILKYNAQKEVVDYNPSDLLNYIFDGYAKICRCEKTLTTIFFELEAGHLMQFNLSLSQVYKRMYHRWIYLELQKLVPECILKLKELDYDDNYTILVQKFIKFDDAMTTVTQTWRDIWLCIQNYHKSKDDIARRRRIHTIRSIFQVIKDSDFDFDPDFVMEEKPLVDWITCEKRNDVWQYIVHKIKYSWKACSHPRINAKFVSLNCSKCNSPFVPHLVTCDCRTCIIAGGPCFSKVKDTEKPLKCTKCLFFDKFMNGVIAKRGVTENAEKPKIEVETIEKLKADRKLYHLSWAVFKHLPDRVPYTGATIDPMTFCVFQDIPCTRLSCRVAGNIISLTYPLNFSKYLVTHYQQVNDSDRKNIMSQMNVSTIRNYDSRDIFSTNKRLHPLLHENKQWATNGDFSRKGEVKEIMQLRSGLAEGFLVDFPMPQKNVIFANFFKLFRIVGTDIDFNVDQLDHIKKPNGNNSKFMASVETTSIKTRGGDQLEDINIRMNNLKLKGARRDSSTCDEASCKGKTTPCSGIADGEIKKPLVEALQLAASNKKLEAELRSLQKEHSMLKDMVRDLEHIHEEKHQCNHSADESSDSRESKSSHRTEGQCICYYCTIFGQNDCSHNSRVNETRDRLRKRLRKMQANGKEHKPLTFKELKMARVNASFTKNVKTRDTSKGKRIVYQQTTTQISSKIQLQPKQVAPVPKTVVSTSPPVEEGTSVQKITPINCAPVDDILKFIEGDAAKKEKEALAAKKAAKKKQKQRKIEQKKVSELDDLKSQYDELCTEEDEILKSLKLLKKRKNKNRLMQAEEKLGDLSTKKTELVTAAKEVIETIRKTNPNFEYDFSEELLEESNEETQQQPQTPPPSLEQRNCEISVDPSKRMVTIRRINLPHSEPQVTVTAKGASPDKDQLLYTFINGQLVPASPTNQQLLQKIKNQASNYTQNYLKPNPQLTVPPPPAQPPTDTAKVQNQQQKQGKNVKKPNPIQMQKLQQQVQKQQQKEIEKEQKKNSNKNEKSTNVSKKEEKKKGKNTEIIEKESKNDTKSKKQLKQQQQQPEPIKSKRQLKLEKRQASIEKSEEEPEKIEKPKTPTVSKKERQKRPTSYIDPEFDNNAFKLLNIDDSESDGDVSANSIASSVEEVVETPKSRPVSTQLQQKPKEQKESKKDVGVVQNEKLNRNERKQSVDSVSSQKSRKNSQQGVSHANTSQNNGNNARGNNNNKQKQQTQNQPKHPHAFEPVQGFKGLKPTFSDANKVDKANGISIMDQLSRGVRVEGLTLPPGITLTRIDPATCENIKAKKESINRISQPLSSAIEQPTAGDMMSTPGYPDSSYMMVNPPFGLPKQDNIIMVGTPQLNHQSSATNGGKNKRSRKKKKSGSEEKNVPTQQQQKHPHQKSSLSSEKVNNENVANNMVTLKNPMFDSVSQSMKKNQPVIGTRPPMSYDQPAAIIKNENGMFTIRNPALHQALSHGQVNPLPHYSTTYGNMNNNSNALNGQFDDVPYTTDVVSNGARKCNSVIGSEIKTAHQIKQAQQKEQQQQQQQHQSHWGGCGDAGGMFGLAPAFSGNVPHTGMNKCYSPFEPVAAPRTSPGGFNSDFVGRIGNDFPTQNYFSPTVGSHFASRNTYSPELGHANYYENVNGNSKYDDTNFLQSLQPGQRLNSEVTIHNINEAKFLRDQQAESNGIEITRIQTPGSMDGSTDASHGERITLNELLKNSSLYQNKQLLDMTSEPGDFTDNIFGSNRPLESPYNNPYYDSAIKSSQSNIKSTIGLNRAPGSKTHASTTTKSSDSPSSSLFGEFSSSLSMSSSNTPPSTDDPLVDFGSNSDPIFYDTNKNGPNSVGVIGGEIKAVHANID